MKISPVNAGLCRYVVKVPLASWNGLLLMIADRYVCVNIINVVYNYSVLCVCLCVCVCSILLKEKVYHKLPYALLRLLTLLMWYVKTVLCS